MIFLRAQASFQERISGEILRLSSVGFDLTLVSKPNFGGFSDHPSWSSLFYFFSKERIVHHLSARSKIQIVPWAE